MSDEKQFITADAITRTGLTQQAVNKRMQRLVRDGWIDPSEISSRNRTKYFNEKTLSVILENPKGRNQAAIGCPSCSDLRELITKLLHSVEAYEQERAQILARLNKVLDKTENNDA